MNIKQLKPNGITVVDLFCGAGIGAIGLKLAGCNIVYAIDNLKEAVDTYNLNIGNHAECLPIQKKNLNDIPNADLIIGGSPCKDFSIAGKGDGIQGKYGSLLFYFIETIRIKKPKSFIFENVDGFVSNKNISDFNIFINNLESLGYCISYQVVNMHDYGVPQKRKRIIVVGLLSNVVFSFPDIVPESNRLTLRDAIGDLPEPNHKFNHYGYGLRNDEAPFVDKVPFGGNWKDLPIEDQKTFMKQSYYSSGGKTTYLRKVLFNKPAYTIMSSMNGKYAAQIIDQADKYQNADFNWWEQKILYPVPDNYNLEKALQEKRLPPRRYTVRECLRIQSVPDSFVFKDEVSLNKQYERCSGIPSLFAYKLINHLIFFL